MKDEDRIALNYAAIDLRIDECLRDLDELVVEYEMEDQDRTLLIYYMRLVYLRGYQDGGGSGL